MQFKRNLSRCPKWVSKLKVHFYQRYCSKFILTSAFICSQSSFLFWPGEKAMKTMSFSYTCFFYYRKDPTNNNKICQLPSSACFQQHFNDWFSVLRYNLDLAKLKWAPLSFNLAMIFQTDANYSPILSLNMLSFHIRQDCLKPAT